MIKLSDVFDIWYGVNLEVVNCRITDEGIPFVSCQSANNGIVCKVERIDNLIPNPKNTLSIAGNGSVLSTFYHQEEYYSGRDVYVAKPKQPLCDMEMLYYCFVIEKNKFRYNYGRKANKTLRDILVPSPKEIPQRYKDRVVVCNFASKPLLAQPQSLNITTNTWKWFTVGEILNCQTTPHCIQQATNNGEIPFVSRSAVNNGVSSYVDATDLVVNAGNCITIGAEGVIAFYQNKNFVSGVKIYSIRHKRLNQYIAMFIITILDREAYRYNYGNARILSKLQREKIKLPATLSGNPDWDFMERYIKSLPYSACLQEEN